jgi:hypothetical protein
MIDGMVKIWNYLTDGKVKLSQEYIEYFFGVIDI